MNLEEAIQWFELEMPKNVQDARDMKRVQQIKRQCYEAFEIAHAAISEKVARERTTAIPADALALEELHGYYNEPVYIVYPLTGWSETAILVNIRVERRLEGRTWFEFKTMDSGTIGIAGAGYGKTWLAYMHKPNGDDPK